MQNVFAVLCPFKVSVFTRITKHVTGHKTWLMTAIRKCIYNQLSFFFLINYLSFWILRCRTCCLTCSLFGLSSKYKINAKFIILLCMPWMVSIFLLTSIKEMWILRSSYMDQITWHENDQRQIIPSQEIQTPISMEKKDLVYKLQVSDLYLVHHTLMACYQDTILIKERSHVSDEDMVRNVLLGNYFVLLTTKEYI